MPQIDLPHGLIKPQLSNDFISSIVANEILEDKVYDFVNFGSGGGRFFKVQTVLETRKAKGSWESRKEHPNFYKCKMTEVPNPDANDLIRLH